MAPLCAAVDPHSEEDELGRTIVHEMPVLGFRRAVKHLNGGTMDQQLALEKIIVVAYPAGRTGSSAIMGALALGGLCAGKEGRLIKEGGMNPKGFFELRTQERFLGTVFRGYYPGPTEPPSAELTVSRCANNMSRFRGFLRKEFSGEGQIAIKAPRWLTLPFFDSLRSEVDVRVLSLTRDLDKQVESTYRVWQQTYDPLLVGADKDQIRQWIVSWQEFAAQMRSRFAATLPIYDISFEALMGDPVAQLQELMGWLGMSCPDEHVIRSWFDAELVDRSTLPVVSRFEAAKRVFKRRIVYAINKPFAHYSPYIVHKCSDNM